MAVEKKDAIYHLDSAALCAHNTHSHPKTIAFAVLLRALTM